MTRSKVKLQYIANDSNRKISFKKRKKGLMKKVNELSTLCGIDACAIIYGQNDREPEVWPSHLGVQRVLAKFRKLPDVVQGNKMVNQESFTLERIRKIQEKLLKQQRENREKEMNQVIFECLGGKRGLNNLRLVDLNDMGWFLDKKIRDIERKIEALKKETLPQGATMADEIIWASETSITAVENNHCNMNFMQPNNPQPGLDGEENMLPYALNSQIQGPSFMYH